MTTARVECWPAAAEVGDKPQGLLDLADSHLPVPPCLIVPGSIVVAGEVGPSALVEAMVRFRETLGSERPLVALRTGTLTRQGGAKVVPETVLCLGIGDLETERDDSRRSQLTAVAAAHAAAAAHFFRTDLPERFGSWGLRPQLEWLVVHLVEFLRQLTDVDDRSLMLQKMVYGDADPRSLTGMCYTRNPWTMEEGDYGRVLLGRQGLAMGGVSSPDLRDLDVLRAINPGAHQALRCVCHAIEERHGTMRKLEFTVEGDQVWVLQNIAGRSKVPNDSSP